MLTHDLESPAPLTRFQPHAGKVKCVTWNHNNRVIATGGEDSQIFLSHSETAEKLGVLASNESSPVNCLSFTSKSDLIAGAYTDGVVRVWDLRKRESTMNFSDHTEAVTCVAWNAIDSQLASSSMSGEIILHSLLTGVSVANFKYRGSGGIKKIAYSPFKRHYLGAASENGSVYVWDCNSRSSVCNFATTHNSPVTGLAFSAVNHMLLCTSGLDQKIQFFDIHEKRPVKTMETDSPITCLSFYGDGHTIGVGTLYGSVQIYDLRAINNTKAVLRGHESTSVNWVEFSKIRNSESRAAPQKTASNFKPISVKDSPLSFPGRDNVTQQRFRSIEEIKQEARMRVEAKRKQRQEEIKPEQPESSESPQTPSESNELKEPNEPKEPKEPKEVKQPKESFEKSFLKETGNIVEETKEPSRQRSQTLPRKEELPKTETPQLAQEPEDLTGKINLIQGRLDRQEDAILSLSDNINNLHVEVIRQFTIQQVRCK